MLHVEPKCAILESILVKNFSAKEPPPPGLFFRYVDFDSTIYNVQTRENSPNCLFISFAMHGFQAIMANGGQEVLTELYGPMVVADTEKLAGADVTLRLDLAALPADKAERERLAAKICAFKYNMLGAPIRHACKMLDAGQQTPKSIHIRYRPDESMWVVVKQDVNVIFSMKMDPQDMPIARIFFNEFAGTVNDRALAGAPRILVSPTRPPEISDTDADTTGVDTFVSFSFKKLHVQGAFREKNIAYVLTFRTYFHYHLKCTKAFIHQRMRSIFNAQLQSINRARPEHGMQSGTKTASGRTTLAARKK